MEPFTDMCTSIHPCESIGANEVSSELAANLSERDDPAHFADAMRIRWRLTHAADVAIFRLPAVPIHAGTTSRTAPNQPGNPV